MVSRTSAFGSGCMDLESQVERPDMQGSRKKVWACEF